jgi:hypothetical protein
LVLEKEKEGKCLLEKKRNRKSEVGTKIRAITPPFRSARVPSYYKNERSVTSRHLLYLYLLLPIYRLRRMPGLLRTSPSFSQDIYLYLQKYVCVRVHTITIVGISKSNFNLCFVYIRVHSSLSLFFI